MQLFLPRKAAKASHVKTYVRVAFELIFISGGDISTALPPCQRAQGQLEADGWSNSHVW